MTDSGVTGELLDLDRAVEGLDLLAHHRTAVSGQAVPDHQQWLADMAPECVQELASVCAECWSEWEKQEVMVINELRLNFMDPRAAEVLHQKLREFLPLPEPGA
jgi:Fe-S cluster biosynthesis and repair protein YggX